MIEAILNAEIPVMGHIGLTPQSVHALGGFKVQGRSKPDAERILEEAQQLAEAGVFALVLECVPSDLAARITEAVPVPTIGIGAGPHCDGQILVLHDMIGLSAPGAKVPKFVKRYADVGAVIAEAARAYIRDVVEGQFPETEEAERGTRRPAGEVVPFASHQG
jgi:3-methyl-2-oxobutanoate hydroxymethyltransferase